MAESEASFGSQGHSNAWRILSKIANVHQQENDFPFLDNQVSEFVDKNGKLFKSLGKLKEEEIAKLERDIENSRKVIASSEFCETLKRIAFYFAGICQEVDVVENTEKLEKQLAIALELLSKAADKNKDLKEIYRFWYAQELARKLRKHLNNDKRKQMFLTLVIGGLSTGLFAWVSASLSMAPFSIGKYFTGLPPWVPVVAGMIAIGLTTYLIDSAVKSGLNHVADSLGTIKVEKNNINVRK